jgi:putative SOS response-associated peptidase YedK
MADQSESDQEVRYKLQSMKWGLIPFWTKRNPDYASVMRTINCRDDSLSSPGGMWASMKGRKRCIVIAQGFFEWLTKGKEKVPHYIRRKDGGLMLLAGLWDCVQYEGMFLPTDIGDLVPVELSSANRPATWYKWQD